MELNRAELISLSTVFLILTAAVTGTTMALAVRSDVRQELEDRHEQLVRLLAAHARGTEKGNAMRDASAPENAFLPAATAALAGAELQSYITRLAAVQHASLISSSVEAASRADAADTVRLQVALDLRLAPLQALLFELETGTPYVFIDVLAVQPKNSASKSTEEPLLHVTLGLRALWRRTTS